VDNSGTISSDELVRVMTLFGQSPSDSEISSIMEKVDKDRSGTIEFEEFVHLMSSNDVDAELFGAFQVFDRDGSGNINLEELRLVMRNLGETLTDGELDLMIKEADLNGDDEISFEEFKKMMLGR